MSNKIIESMIEDYRRTIERLQKERAELTDANILLIGHIKTTEARLRALNEDNGKQWVTEKCGTNTPPLNPPQKPSIKNKTLKEIELETQIKELESENKRLKQSNCDIRKSRKATDAMALKYFQQLNRSKARIKELMEENNTLKAQVETFSTLMNVYKDISKGRQDSKAVTDYISKLDGKLKIAEETLEKISQSDIPGYFIYTDNSAKDSILNNLHTKG